MLSMYLLSSVKLTAGRSATNNVEGITASKPLKAIRSCCVALLFKITSRPVKKYTSKKINEKTMSPTDTMANNASLSVKEVFEPINCVNRNMTAKKAIICLIGVDFKNASVLYNYKRWAATRSERPVAANDEPC